MFFNEKFNDTGKEAGLSDLSLKNSWGAAGVAGLDYLINRYWLSNASVRYMDIDTDVRVKAGGQQQSVSTRLDPWGFMFSAGYRFFSSASLLAALRSVIAPLCLITALLPQLAYNPP